MNKLMMDGMEVSNTYRREVYDIGGHRIIYLPEMGWAWDMTTGKDGAVRWNNRRTSKDGYSAEAMRQLGSAMAKMNK